MSRDDLTLPSLLAGLPLVVGGVMLQLLTGAVTMTMPLPLLGRVPLSVNLLGEHPAVAHVLGGVGWCNTLLGVGLLGVAALAVGAPALAAAWRAARRMEVPHD